MNKKRRLKLRESVMQLDLAVKCLDKAYNIIGEVQDEESDAMDNIPENLQCTERFESMEYVVSELDEIVDSICDIISSTEDASNGIQNIL